MKRVALFVDVQNIYYTTRDAYGQNFDYNAFWAAATQGREVVKAFAYAVEKGDEKQQQFQNILRGIGFEVRLKRYLQRADGSSKGDWDVGIVLDVLDYAPQADVVVLASGDGDFEPLVERVINRHGVEVEVYGVPRLSAVALKAAATRFLPIDAALLLPRKSG
jgi:uncharacterized LabA/DUF88 family protein